MTAPDPDVRVVVLGLKGQAKKLQALFRERQEAERLSRALLADLERLDKGLKRLEREVKRG